MRNYLWTIIGLSILFSASLDAQCRRGEQLRITNDVEIKVVDCREATRLIYNDGWYPYSIEDERDISKVIKNYFDKKGYKHFEDDDDDWGDDDW